MQAAQTQAIPDNRSVGLSSSYVIPHPARPYVLRPWWTSSTGKEAASGCPPNSRRPPPAGGMRPSCPFFLCALPGRCPFLPEPLLSLLSYVSQPAIIRTGRKGFILTNQKKQQHRSVCPTHASPPPVPQCPKIIRAWWTSSTGTEPSSGCPPELDVRRQLGDASITGGVRASHGRRPFLPGPPYSPPPPLSYIP